MGHILLETGLIKGVLANKTDKHLILKQFSEQVKDYSNLGLYPLV